MNVRQPAHASDLPASVVDIAETLGIRVVLALIENFGGRDIRFPVKPRADHPVMKALGETDGMALCQLLNGQIIYVPRKAVADLRPRIDALAVRQLTRAEIARHLNISERHVRRLANSGRDDRQGDLFD